MPAKYQIVDLFSGPGGLAEGFWGYQTPSGSRPYSLSLSVEMEKSAHATLVLRNFLRQFDDGFPNEYYHFLNRRTEQGKGKPIEPDWLELYPQQYQRAIDETLCLELGSDGTSERINPRLDDLREGCGGDTVLIGGPPCQAYSLVGRVRNAGKRDYDPASDHRHYLYKEYLQVLQRLKPAAFVMENVKGILSSKVDGQRIFHRVLDDLYDIGEADDAYRLVALTPSAKTSDLSEVPAPEDFLVRAEERGIPQARHRVIIIGIRKDKWRDWRRAAKGRADWLHHHFEQANARHVLAKMPVLRSGLSKGGDSFERWRAAILEGLDGLANITATGGSGDALPAKQFQSRVAELQKYFTGLAKALPRAAFSPAAGIANDCPLHLRDWLLDPQLRRLPNNETRGHMASDLQRYLFAAIHGELVGISPKAGDYPAALAPDHKNWKSGKFADRFRVQLWERPSTTVTCHISKDGHYFIHPDPRQCRSLTVREAARLQTFPDNYFFRGNRTQQYVQVGNAVPPLLARGIAETLHAILEGGNADKKIRKRKPAIVPSPRECAKQIQT